MNVFGIEFRCVVNMQNIFCQFMVRREIVPADKTFRIKKLLYLRVSPVNGNRVHMEGVDKFLCAPTCPAGVFEGEVETIAGEPINLHLVAVTGG